MKKKAGRPWAVADCETDPFSYGQRVEPFIWGFFDGNEYRTFDSTAAFVEHIRGFNGILYMHNGGKFDALFLTPWIRGPVLMIHNRLASCHVGLCNIRDSYCILPVSLSTYKKDDFDYALLNRDVRGIHIETIRAYLENDCRYLHEFVGRFIEQYGQPVTLASAAMGVWESKFAPPLKYLKGDAGRRWYETFSHYYTGGRTQCFKVGEYTGAFTIHDINSAYPFAMSGRIPWGYKTDVCGSLIEGQIDLGFFDITATSRGAFPLNGAYPHVTGRFSVTGAELRAALNLGLVDIQKIRRAIYFRNHVTFADYVGHYFSEKAAAKKAGDQAGYIFAKLFLNSLYGKYAANPATYTEAVILEAPQIKAAALGGARITPIGDGLYAAETALPEFKRNYYNVATAAAVTGAVRAMLLTAIQRAGSSAIYCDTDSIAAGDVQGLEVGDALGQWSREAVCDYAAVAGKKLYAFHHAGRPWTDKPAPDAPPNWKRASKGVRLLPSEIVRVAKGETIRFEKESPSFSLKTGQRFIAREIRATG